MKKPLIAVAALTVLGLAACSPTADDTDAMPAEGAGADASTMAPADTAGVGAMSSETMPPATGATPPGDGSIGTAGTMNPDGTMNDGSVNPASPPPITSPDTMNPPKAN